MRMGTRDEEREECVEYESGGSAVSAVPPLFGKNINYNKSAGAPL